MNNKTLAGLKFKVVSKKTKLNAVNKQTENCKRT